MSQAQQPPTVADLEREARRNPTIAAHLQAWRHGQFATFEQCLVALAVDLARTVDCLKNAGMFTNPWKDPVAIVGPLKSFKLDADTVEKLNASFDALSMDAQRRIQEAAKKRCAKIVADMLNPPSPKPFTTEGKSIGEIDDVAQSFIVEDKPRG